MNDRLKKLREKRGRVVKEMRAITDLAENEKRDMSAEEADQHDKLFDQTDSMRKLIVAEERQVELDREQASTEIQQEERMKKPTDKDTPQNIEMRAFRKHLNGNMRSMSEAELRALNAGTDVDGGYLRAPQEFVKQLLKGIDDNIFIRERATKFQIIESASMGVPTLDTDMGDADWTTELATGAEDNAMKFGKRELSPHPLAKRIKISKKLLRSATLPIEQIVMDRLRYKFGVTQEKAFLLGDGVNKPLGIFTASANGISTGRDVSEDNTATAITTDGLISAKYKLKAAYWNKADWLFHPDAIKMLTKLKNAEGQYIWRESMRAGEPDTLLGRPLMISEFAPNTFVTGNYVGVFGDFSNYWIADALNLQVQHLYELYAESNQDGFIGRLECDGMPVLEEAFARVKLA